MSPAITCKIVYHLKVTIMLVFVCDLTFHNNCLLFTGVLKVMHTTVASTSYIRLPLLLKYLTSFLCSFLLHCWNALILRVIDEAYEYETMLLLILLKNAIYLVWKSLCPFAELLMLEKWSLTLTTRWLLIDGICCALCNWWAP